MDSCQVVAIAGAKGGVGKTTSSINLGVALAERGHSVVVVELDLAMANLVDFLSLAREDGPTMHEVLAGEAAVNEALVSAPGGITVAPSATSIDGLGAVDVSRIQAVTDALSDRFDAVVLDTAAGMDSAATTAFAAADHAVLVSTPRVAALRDADKTARLVERAGGNVLGLLLTKTGTGTAPDPASLAAHLDVPLLGTVPDDPSVPASQDAGVPVVDRRPEGPVAAAYRDAARRLQESVSSGDAGRVDSAGESVGGDQPTASRSSESEDPPATAAAAGDRTETVGGETDDGDPADEIRDPTDETRRASERPSDATGSESTPSKAALEAQGWTFPQAEDDADDDDATASTDRGSSDVDTDGATDASQATDGGTQPSDPIETETGSRRDGKAESDGPEAKREVVDSAGATTPVDTETERDEPAGEGVPNRSTGESEPDRSEREREQDLSTGESGPEAIETGGRADDAASASKPDDAAGGDDPEGGEESQNESDDSLSSRVSSLLGL